MGRSARGGVLEEGCWGARGDGEEGDGEEGAGGLGVLVRGAGGPGVLGEGCWRRARGAGGGPGVLGRGDGVRLLL